MDTSFLYDYKSKASETSGCDINSINDDSKTTSRQYSFDEEIYLIRTEIEYNQKAKEMIHEFDIIRVLLNISQQEIKPNTIFINTRLEKPQIKHSPSNSTTHSF